MATRLLVRQREAEACAICGGATGTFQVHHRRPRGLGGSRCIDTNGLANLVYVHTGCHADLESHRERAVANGWLIRQGFDPSTVPFLYRGRWVLLTELGSVEQVAA